MCTDCYNNKANSVSIFFSGFLGDPDELKDYCCQCKGHNMTQMNITSDELLALLNISKDPDFIITFDKLKQDDIIEFNLKLSQLKSLQPQTDNIPKCPTCGSTNIKKISGGKRWLTTGLFGLASSDVGKTMQCDNCGAKW